MAVKKGLGRGIDLLIPMGNPASNSPKSKKQESKDNNEEVKMEEKSVVTAIEKVSDGKPLFVSINEIEPNRNQPRKLFDEDAIEELSDSIKQYGILQPLIVQKKNDYYEIIAGERRWRASKKAGLKEIPVYVKEIEDKDILKVSLIENLQREDLNPIEEAKAYQILQTEYGLKHDEIAASVSKSRTAITNTMRLLKLTEEVQNMIIEGIISSGHGRTLIIIEDPKMQCEAAMKILDEEMSVREAEKYVKKLLNQKKEEKQPVDQQNLAMIDFFENRMKEILGSKVQIKEKKNNKGKIEIEYYSHDELQRIIDLIQSIHREA